MLGEISWLGAAGMSYDVNRLRGVHPPACTCVECQEGRTRRRGRGGNRSGSGGGKGSGGGRRGCLPWVTVVALAVAAMAAAAMMA